MRPRQPYLHPSGTATAPLPPGENHPSLVVKRWPNNPRSVAKARHLLLAHLNAWDLTHLADSAELVLSELLTNSVRHARIPGGRLIETRYERLTDAVRIEVHDANENKPERRAPSADDDSGRGLTLVDALTAGRWGVSARDGVGKLVWAVCADGSGPRHDRSTGTSHAERETTMSGKHKGDPAPIKPWTPPPTPPSPDGSGGKYLGD